MFVIKHDMKYCYMSVAPVRLISDSQAIPSVPYQHRCAVFNTHGHGHTCHLRRARTSISSSIAQLCMFLYYQVWERERDSYLASENVIGTQRASLTIAKIEHIKHCDDWSVLIIDMVAASPCVRRPDVRRLNLNSTMFLFIIAASKSTLQL